MVNAEKRCTLSSFWRSKLLHDEWMEINRLIYQENAFENGGKNINENAVQNVLVTEHFIFYVFFSFQKHCW